MKHHAALVLALVMVSLFGCKEDPSSVRKEGSSDLMDPNVQPAVIYTNPPQNGIGPFTTLANGYTFGNGYHFLVQFNKLMIASQLEYGDKVTVSGFDEPVSVNTAYSGNTYNNIFRFMIRRKDSYQMVPYTIGKQYTVRIKGTAEDIHGYTLGGDYTFTFTPEPTFRVVEITPSGDIEYGTVSPMVRFNSKVTSSVLSHLSISPAKSGSWLVSSSDSTYVFFNPFDDFILGTPYTVSVDGTAKDAAGNTIKAPASGTFMKNAAFKVTGMYYGTSSGTPVINVYTNGQLDSTTTRSAVTVTPSYGHRMVFYGQSTSFQIILDSLDTPDTQFTVAISSASKSTTGLSLQPYSYTMTTPSFYIEQFFPQSYEVASRYTPVEFRTNYPIDTTTAAAAISISPDVARTVTADGRFIHVKFTNPLSPRTQYSVTVSTALKTKKGSSLSYSNTYSFRTGD